MAQAHAKRASYCTCGKTVHGNGGEWMHAQMHKRKADGHYYMTYSEYCRRREQQADRDRPKPDPITGMQPGRLTDIIR